MYINAQIDAPWGVHVGGAHPNKKIKSATTCQLIIFLIITYGHLKLNKEKNNE